MDLTSEKLTELRRLEAAASRAPWLQPIEDEPRLISDASGILSLLALTKDDEAIVGSDADATLIVAMRNGLGALLDELESARRELSSRNLLLQDLGNKYLLPAQPLSELPAVLEVMERELAQVRFDNRFRMGSRELRCSICKYTDDLCECQPEVKP